MKPLTAKKLTKEQLIVLCALRGGSVTLRKLGDMTGRVHSTVCRLVSGLRDMGLVECTVGSQNSLHLTPKGRAAVKEIVLIRYQNGEMTVGQVERVP